MLIVGGADELGEMWDDDKNTQGNLSGSPLGCGKKEHTGDKEGGAEMRLTISENPSPKIFQ